LTKDEREKVKELRKLRNKNKGNKTRGARNASAVQKGNEDVSDDDSSYADESDDGSDDKANVSSLNRQASPSSSAPPTRRTGRSLQN
jgi:hypothetical protein